MIFWGAKFLVAVVSLWALIANWRIGVTLTFALGIEFVTYLWMAMPLFTVRYEMAAVWLLGALVGTVISLGRRRLSPPWLPAAIAALALFVLRGSLYLQGFASGHLGPEELKATLPSSLVLIVAAGSALLLPGLVASRSTRPVPR